MTDYTIDPGATIDRLIAERDAALGREAALKEVTCFKDAVACVFDNLKMVACNTDDRALDDRLEDLAEDVIEMAPEYKKQWKDICRLTAENHELQQRLTAADERAHVLDGLLREVQKCARKQDWASGYPTLFASVDAALKPAEGGGDAVGRMSLSDKALSLIDEEIRIKGLPS